MNSWTREEIERAARYGDERMMCDALDNCFSNREFDEAQEIIREHGSRSMVTKFGPTTFFGEIEIDSWGHSCPR